LLIADLMVLTQRWIPCCCIILSSVCLSQYYLFAFVAHLANKRIHNT